jgi:periplasmic protein TonB
MVEPTTNLDGANQPGAEPTLRLNSLRSSHQQSSFSSLFSNLKDFLTERPVKVRAGDSKTFAMPGFGAGLGDNLKEFFHAGPKGPVNSGLLVSWDDGVGGFWQNLRDMISPRKLPPLKTTSQPVAVPEIWSKNPQFTRVQAISVMIHVVVLSLLILPFLPGWFLPGTTKASSPISSVDVISPYLPKLAPAAKKAGGGGGQRNLTPATRGQAPKFSYLQISKPLARPPENPKLPVTPTLLGNPALNVPNITAQNWGDPLSKVLGSDSLGQGSGTGIGDGKGAGLGPGSEYGTGGGTPTAGTGGYGSPACLYCPSPAFSDEAVKAKYQGVVELLALITADGHATDIKVAKGLGLGLDEKAVEAVRNWRFKPALGPDGKPASVRQLIEVTFHLY